MRLGKKRKAYKLGQLVYLCGQLFYLVAISRTFMPYSSLLLPFLFLLSPLLLLAQERPSFAWGQMLSSQMQYGGQAEGLDLYLGPRGELYLLGYFNGSIDFNPAVDSQALRKAKGKNDLFVAKYNRRGDFQWVLPLGSYGNDAAQAIDLNAQGELLVTGYFSDSLYWSEQDYLLSEGEEDVFILRISEEGEALEAVSFGGKGSDQGLDIKAYNHSIYITGEYREEFSALGKKRPAFGGSDIFVGQIEGFSDWRWLRTLGSKGADLSTALSLSSLGELYLAATAKGSFIYDDFSLDSLQAPESGAALLLKYSPLGDLIWKETLAATAGMELSDIVVNSVGEAFMTGSFRGELGGLKSAGESDIFLAQFHRKGRLNWIKRFGGTGDDRGQCIEIVGRKLLGIAGRFSGQIVEGEQEIRAQGEQSDLFIAQYSFEGNFKRMQAFGGPLYEEVQAMKLNLEGQVFLTGSFEGAADFDPSPRQALLNSNAIQTLFVAHYQAKSLAYDFAFAMGYRYDASLSRIEALYPRASGEILTAVYFEGALSINSDSLLKSKGRWGDILISQYDSLGRLRWFRQFGGLGADKAEALYQTAAAESFLGGSYGADFYLSDSMYWQAKGEQDAFLLKLDSLGGLIWAKEWKSLGEVDLLAIKEQPNGELLVLLSHRGDRLVYEGQTLLDKSGFLLLSLSVDSGRLGWFKTFDCLAPNRGRLALDEQGQIYLGLSFSEQLKLGHRQNQLLRAAGEQDLAILALDRGGDFRWARLLGGRSNERLGELLYLPKLGVYLGGSFEGTAAFGPRTHKAVGSRDAFLVHYSKAGDFRWVKPWGGNQKTRITAMAAVDSQQILLTGYFQGEMPASDSIILRTSNLLKSDIFLMEVSARDARLSWAKALDGSGNDRTKALVVSNKSSIYLGASFESRFDADPSKGERIFENKGLVSTALLLKYLNFAFQKLELVAFRAKRKNIREVELRWTTPRETENKGFLVERRLAGSKDFHAVGFIPGFGNSQAPTNYRFTDVNAFDGNSYYRFRQLSNHGQEAYSEVVFVRGWKSKEGGQLAIYPNPVEKELNLRFGRLGKKMKSARIRIYDQRRRVKLELKAGLSSNELLILEDLSDLEAGAYILEIRYNNRKKREIEFIKV